MTPRVTPFDEPLEPRQLFAAFDVLVLSKTDGFRHTSIDEGIDAIEDLGAANDFTVTATENASAISDANLVQYEAVVFLSTTGDFLNDTQQTALENYIANGGGWVGIHAAADAEYDWAWYGGLVGAFFDEHPDRQTATVHVENASDPLAEGLPATWSRFDEWYNYRSNPRAAGVTVVQTLDEATYQGGTMGDDHPITWYRPYMGGRSFYTGMGHTEESYADADFRELLLRGIQYAATATAEPTPPTADASADVTSGSIPLTIQFSSAGTDPGDRGPLTYAWDFDDDGTVDSTAANPMHVYEQAGTFTARLVVTNTDDVTSADTVVITATTPTPSNPAPVATADAATTPRDTAVVINVLANDTDDDALNPASIEFPSQPAHGSLTPNTTTGAVTYTPAGGFTGIDTFTYTVRDSEGAASDPATVSVAVTTPTPTPNPTPTPTPAAALSVELTGELPAAVVGGTKAKTRAVATVTNVGQALFNDRVTISLYASADQSIDDSDALIPGIVRKLKLAPGAARSLPIKIAAFPAVPDGDYQLLARAASASTAESNTAVAPQPVTIAAPFRDLTSAALTTLSGDFAPQARAVVRVRLTNLGNDTASGVITASILDAGATGPSQLFIPPLRVNLKPGASKVFKLRFQLPTVPSNHVLTFDIVNSGAIGDTNRTNDFVTVGTIGIVS